MNPRVRPGFLALAAFALTLPAAKNGCGSKEGIDTLLSPVQAVTSVLELPDGSVEAELVLISTAASPHSFVDSAKNVTLRVPGGKEVALTPTSPGHYTASSADDAALVYAPGETYQFHFELDDEAAAEQVAGGNFVAVMDAPDYQPSFEVETPPEFTGDTATLMWSPSSYAIIRVVHESGETTYDDFDFSEPQFDGSKWARLASGGRKDLGVDAFPEPGAYTIEVCTVDKVSDWDAELSAELGWLSGFLIGRCAEPQSVEVAE
jgi:hypothetical protein